MDDFYQVAIFGSGFSGLWTSIHLSKLGVDNVILTSSGLHGEESNDFGTKEKVPSSVIHAASRLNCGLIMPSGPRDRKANFYVETYNQILERQNKVDWQPRPVLEVATNKTEFEFGKSWLKTGKNIEWLELLTKEEVHQREPRIKTEGGVLFKKSGTVNPVKLLMCLEDEVKSVKTNFKFATITKSNGYFLVSSKDGMRVRCKKIVLALGAGTNDFAKEFLDLDVPVKAVRGTMWMTKDTRSTQPLKFNLCSLRSAVFYSEKNDSLLPRTTNKDGELPHTDHLYSQITPSGDFICGGEREEISENLAIAQNEKRSDEAVSRNKEFVSSIWPELQSCQIDRTWTGLMPWTTDGNPMIGPIEPNIFINTGLQSAGLMMGAGAGKYCAEFLHKEIIGLSSKPDFFCDPRRFNIKFTAF